VRNKSLTLKAEEILISPHGKILTECFEAWKHQIHQKKKVKETKHERMAEKYL